MSGAQAAQPTSLQLAEGKNLVPIISEAPISPLNYFADIENDIVYIRDNKGKTMRKVNDEWINNIGDLIGGKSYILKTSKEVTLQID